MDYKAKLAAVRRFEQAMRTTVQRYYTDDVGTVRHTPRSYYLVMKRNLKQEKAKFKRRELRHFAKVAFLVANCPDLQRRGVELVFAQMLNHAFLIDLLLTGFAVSTVAIRRAIARIFALVGRLAASCRAFFARLCDIRLYLTFLQLLV